MTSATTPGRLRLDTLRDVPLSARDKGLPARSHGLSVADFLATEPRLAEFWTPLVTLTEQGIAHNLDVMARWTASRGLQLMPHGKTTMAPALWQRQLDAGCTGITLATPGQVRTARSFGLDSIMLANELVDPAALAWLARELADPGLHFACWADSLEGVEAMERALLAAGTPRPVDVCVELGADGGRTGVRTLAEAQVLAVRIAASDVLRLAGVAGYEGNIGRGRSAASLGAVRRYLERQVELHAAFDELYDDAGDRFVTAGGSVYFDVVADVYAEAMADDHRTRWTLRSGAYIVHDDGFYREISPLDGAAAASVPETARFRPAMHGIGRVLSRPEPGLALLDGGKRDFPYDEGLPIPRGVAAALGEPFAPLDGATVSKLNDQHCYVELSDPAAAAAVTAGAVVTLGLSHPCTTFDKWRLLPVLAAPDSDRVVDLVQTYF